MLKNKRNKTRSDFNHSVRLLYRLDPILWATVRGLSTPTAIATKLNWSLPRTDRAISRSATIGYTKLWGNRLIPSDPTHQAMMRKWKHLHGLGSRFVAVDTRSGGLRPTLASPTTQAVTCPE